jgi:type IV pilus assembly protein PilO
MENLFPPGLLQRMRGKILFAALLAVANGVLLLAFLLPAGRQRNLLTAATAGRKDALVAQEQAETAAGMVAGRFRDNERELAAFAGRLLPRAEFERFLGELFDFSSRAGLVLDRIQYDPDLHPEPRILEYRLRFSLEGSYDQIRKFISLLENSPRLIAIRTLQFSGEGIEAGRIRVSMEIDTYFRTEDA